MKLNVSFGSLVLLTLGLDYLEIQANCISYQCKDSSDGILLAVFISSLICFLITLALKFLPKNSYRSWWSFAKYAIPIVFVLSTFISAGFHHNPDGKWQDIFDIPALFTIYGIFIIGSLIQISRGYFSKSN
jgi:hypothetical protein